MNPRLPVTSVHIGSNTERNQNLRLCIHAEISASSDTKKVADDGVRGYKDVMM